MPDIREKPKMDKPKLLDKKVRLPQEAGRQLKEKYIQELKRTEAETGNQPESAGEYATGRVESAAQKGAAIAEKTLHSGAVRYSSRQAGTNAEARQQGHTESAGAENPISPITTRNAHRKYTESSGAGPVVVPLGVPATLNEIPRFSQELQPPEPYTEQENAGEYATERVERATQSAVDRGERAMEKGLDRFRRQRTKEKIKKQRREYAASGSSEPPSSPTDTPKPPVQEYTDTVSAEPSPTQPVTQERAAAPRSNRSVNSGRATTAPPTRGRIREQGHITNSTAPPNTSAPVSKNASQIETHFNIKEKKTTRTIRERGTVPSIKTVETGRQSVKAASAVPKARGYAAPAAKRTAKRAEKRIRQKAAKEAAKKGTQAAKTTGKAAVRVTKAVVASAAKGISAILAAGGGAILLVLLLFVGAIAAFASSPFGIFFATEKSAPDTVSVAEAVAEVNTDFNAQLEALQGGEYDSITVTGQPPPWTEVLAVFAAKTAAADDGTDVATLDARRVELLKAVFWDMTAIATEEETIDTPDSSPDDDIDDSGTERILHITITAKTAEEMRGVYAFTDYQNDALTELLAEHTLNTLAGDLSITNVDAKALLAALPDDLAPERRAVIEAACTLVGKVNYFWGGKSLVIGWDSRWGQLQKVWAEGSKTTGTYRPYGLDCSGFVDWAFYQASGGAYIIGHGGGAAMQHDYCSDIAWSEALPGDLVFYPDDDHVGIVGGRDEAGNLLIIHCASSRNNVVITDLEGFISIGRPDYFNASQFETH